MANIILSDLHSSHGQQLNLIPLTNEDSMGINGGSAYCENSSDGGWVCVADSMQGNFDTGTHWGFGNDGSWFYLDSNNGTYYEGNFNSSNSMI